MKKEFKGTPGPWIAYGITQVATKKGHYHILPENAPQTDEYTIAKNSWEALLEADADLIAAAPELLESLQDMVEAWGNVIPQLKPLKYEKVYLQAKEVINKALGE